MSDDKYNHPRDWRWDRIIFWGFVLLFFGLVIEVAVRAAA